ncbi:hypothetical protein HYC85_013402 [Camellia sinensis]|uniref:Uncharacterized protein n=1 Tax=Camellia sinensis TaxID=4442 RepID=A0A7J7H4L0_CAMSI|nr:hypothetical protein HYC85_013402 [Camellia sinensis]
MKRQELEMRAAAMENTSSEVEEAMEVQREKLKNEWRMGGGGQVDPTAANNANTALYTTFAVFGILGGGIYNILGPRATLFAGCSTYVLYAGSFLYYNHYHHQPIVLTAGALLGVGAGLLWAGQGAIMTA